MDSYPNIGLPKNELLAEVTAALNIDSFLFYLPRIKDAVCAGTYLIGEDLTFPKEYPYMDEKEYIVNAHKQLSSITLNPFNSIREIYDLGKISETYPASIKRTLVFLRLRMAGEKLRDFLDGSKRKLLISNILIGFPKYGLDELYDIARISHNEKIEPVCEVMNNYAKERNFSLEDQNKSIKTINELHEILQRCLPLPYIPCKFKNPRRWGNGLF
jgi:hypothetical protein